MLRCVREDCFLTAHSLQLHTLFHSLSKLCHCQHWRFSLEHKQCDLHVQGRACVRVRPAELFFLINAQTVSPLLAALHHSSSGQHLL